MSDYDDKDALRVLWEDAGAALKTAEDMQHPYTYAVALDKIQRLWAQTLKRFGPIADKEAA